MAEHHLLTIWRIEAPLEEVYAAIHNSQHWPDWWPTGRSCGRELKDWRDASTRLW